MWADTNFRRHSATTGRELYRTVQNYSEVFRIKSMTHLLRCNSALSSCNSCFIILSVYNSLVTLRQLFHTSDNKRTSLDFELFITLNSESEKVINGAAFRSSGHKSSDFQLSSKSVSLGTFAPRATPRRLKISHSMVRSEPPSASILPFTPRALVRALSLSEEGKRQKNREKYRSEKNTLEF